MNHPTPFHDLNDYMALPRLAGLTLAPDGSRLVTSVATPDAEGTKYVSSLWEVDPTGSQPAKRLTHGTESESQPVMTSGGDLLFTAKRDGEEEPSALWLLPRGGGEAERYANHPGGIGTVVAARSSSEVIVAAETLPSATDLDDEQARRTARKQKKVSAILHRGYPVRYWDHDLGPAAPRLYTARATTGTQRPSPEASDESAKRAASHELRELADAGQALREAAIDVASQGDFLVTTWARPEARGSQRDTLVRIDVASGKRTVLHDDPDVEVANAVISPDGTKVAVVLGQRSTAEQAPRFYLALVPSSGGTAQAVATGWDRWPAEVDWTADGSGLLVIADDEGRGRLFHVDSATDEVTRLTDEGALSNLQVGPDGRAAYALRSSYSYPPEIVRIDLTVLGSGQLQPGSAPVSELRGPTERPSLPGDLVEVTTSADDGVALRAWLVLPDGASAATPAPLLLWIHGGPLNSWNGWSWRWNPWIMAARGYAVLLPDPALSTGYGQDFIQRGWGAWGQAPFTDLMSLQDAAEQRADIDEARTAAMGGSFGGYMANWVAGHTDRFQAIVTHASLWALDAFGPTTDAAYFWQREMSPEMAAANSPHRHVANIRTPMLVIHGDKDYRVPIGEGLRLWYELHAHSGLPAAEDGSSPHRFLYFPDENHWILTPPNATVWYEVIEAFLAEHVLGQGEQQVPETLG